MTALCLTRNRRQWLPKAIACFLNQIYPNKELLIVADGVDVRDLVPEDDRIRLIHIEECRTIGEKRNFGCAHARGEIILHWDDDDHSEPERIAAQVALMRESGKSVIGYTRMAFTDGVNWWRYIGASILGTSLCYLKRWHEVHPFPPMQVGEDGQFVHEAAAAGQLHTVDAGRMQFATIHAGNTSPRHLTGDHWEKLAGYPDE